MVDLTIIGAGITGLLISELFKGETVIYEKERFIEKLNSNASLWTIIPPLCGEYIEQCFESENFYEEIGSKLDIYYKRTYALSDQNLSSKIISNREIQEIEPDISLNSEMRLIENSFFIEGEELLKYLISSHNVKLGKNVVALEVKDDEVKKLIFDNGEKVDVERLVLANGYWINNLYQANLQPFKGHLIITKTRHNIKGILHYRGKIIVKGKENLYINGDAKKDSSLSIDYESVRDNLIVASSVIPFSKDIRVRVGFRSVSENGKPIIRKIYKNAIVVSGFRFGFALAPYLANQAIKLLEGM